MRLMIVLLTALVFAGCTSHDGMKSDFVAGSWYDALCTDVLGGTWSNAPNGTCASIPHAAPTS